MTAMDSTAIVERRDRRIGKIPGLKVHGYREDHVATHAIERSSGSHRGPLQLNPP
jgi:hypothetical protein